MRNERTPRVLSECSFRTGYPAAHPRTRRAFWADLARIVVVLVCAAGIGAMLAMGV